MKSLLDHDVVHWDHEPRRDARPAKAGTPNPRFMERWNQEALSLSRRSERTHIRCQGCGRGSQRVFCLGAVVLLWLAGAGDLLGKPAKSGPEPVMLVVMDPLSKELACACVKRCAERGYRKLAARLETAIKQRARIAVSDDLAESRAGVR